MEWEKIEQQVNEAEKSERRARKASRVLHSETGELKSEREGKDDEDILQSAKRKRVAEKALSREKFFEQEADEILGSDDSPERSLANFRKKELVKALRYDKSLEMQRSHLVEEEVEILKDFDGTPSGEEQEALQDIRAELQENSEMNEKMTELSPEAYFGLHLKNLKEYKKNMEDGKIVETPYVKEQIEDVVKHLRAGKPCLVYGHLGSGKTELAMHVARKYIGKEALVISGSKHTTLSELYGHQILTVDEKSGSTVSDYFLGPIYSAMAEERPVIIDEVNAIPHEVLISLNHILTRKVGDKVNVQQNSGSAVEVREGFGILMTGNLNQGQEIYVDREDMDPAFLSRLHKIEYDYLPQNTEGALAEAGKEDELFHLLMAGLMDRNGNLEVPEDTVKKIWNLAKSARITQDVFAGKEVSQAFYFQEAGGRAMKYLLKENLLSMRALENVLGQWKAEGYSQELDYYVWNNFIKEGTVAGDRSYLYQMMKDQFGFFKSEGWEQSPDYGTGGVINSFNIEAPKNKPAKTKFFGPREVVEFSFGKAPERAKWPEIEDAEDGESEEGEVEMSLEKIMELEKMQNDLAKKIAELENI